MNITLTNRMKWNVLFIAKPEVKVIYISLHISYTG